MGIRDERKAATASEIQRIALDLVEEVGLDATTVSQIARRVGISDRTFFRYFESREAAILPGQLELIGALVDAPMDPTLSPAEIFQVLLEVCHEHFASEIKHHEFRRISRLMIHDPKLLLIATRHEQELVTTVSESLVNRGLLDYMQALLVSEMLASTWRVAWQCFGREEVAGRDASPLALFKKAVVDLGRIAKAVPAGE